MAIKEIKLLDTQTFITPEGRDKYFNIMKDSYSYYRFTKADGQYILSFYDEVTYEDKERAKGYVNALDNSFMGYM